MAQVIVNGLLLGSTYTLMALGITLIFAIMNVMNFAHGQMYVFGGFVTYYVFGQWHMPYPIALAASAIAVAAIGVLFERFLFRPVMRRSSREETTMLLAVGTALLLDSVAHVVFGEKQRGVPDVISGGWQVAGAFIPWRRVLVFFVAIALSAGFLAFIQYTRPGRALRAIAQDRETAAAHGVDVSRYSMLGFAIGAMLAGLAGGLLVTTEAVNAGAGNVASIKAFTIIMIGGAGVVSGAIAGAFLLAFAEAIGLLPDAGKPAVPDDSRGPDRVLAVSASRRDGQKMGLMVNPSAPRDFSSSVLVKLNSCADEHRAHARLRHDVRPYGKKHLICSGRV